MRNNFICNTFTPTSCTRALLDMFVLALGHRAYISDDVLTPVLQLLLVYIFEGLVSIY